MRFNMMMHISMLKKYTANCFSHWDFPKSKIHCVHGEELTRESNLFFFFLNGYRASPSEPQIRGNKLAQGKGKIT